MPAPLNRTPCAWVPAYIEEKVRLKPSKKGYPLGMRRLYGAMNQTRPSCNPSFIHALGQAPRRSYLDDRVSRAVDAVVKAIFFNFDYVSGLVNIRTERELAVMAGIATYAGKIVIKDGQYKQIALNEPDDAHRYIAYESIPVTEHPRIGHGRIGSALAVLRCMGVVEYNERVLRADGRYVGRPLWVTDKFYEAFGIPMDGRIEKERLALARKQRFLERHGIQTMPETLAEAKRMVEKVNRSARFAYFRRQRAKRRENREAKKLASMTDSELRAHISQKLQRNLIRTGQLQDYTREDLHKAVEYEFSMHRNLADRPQTEPIQSTNPLH